MRRSLSKLTALATAVLFGVLMVSACEGPQGPAGQDGVDGVDGVDGTNGVDGQDANENCVQCHFNDTELLAKQIQYQNSFHFVGGDFERATTDCAPCHTNEGFKERMDAGTMVTAADIDNPTPPNCRTCHQIHTTYTDADWAFTYTGPVDLWYTADEVATQVDFNAEGNLCANCHQARVVAPNPVIGGADVTFTSSRYGTHHSPVALGLGGVGYFEFTGSATIAGGPSSHGNTATNAKACATCHMGQAFGAQAGGHTFAMTYEYHSAETENITVCTGCHSTLTTFDYNGVQTAIQGKLTTLENELRLRCIMEPAPSTLFVPGTYSANLAAAAINFQTATEDKSSGVHNPAYINAVLTNTIEVVQAMAVPVCP